MTLPKSKGWVSGLRPTQETGTNPKDEFGIHKVPLGLISPTASAIQAICMQDGAEKYGPYNPRVSKVQALIYLEAAKRHIDALLDGEDFDSVTGKPHVGYAIATLVIYCDAWINGMLIDNRPLPGSAGLLHGLFTRAPGEADFTPAEIRSKINYVINYSKGVYDQFKAPAPSDKNPSPPSDPIGSILGSCTFTAQEDLVAPSVREKKPRHRKGARRKSKHRS